MDRLKKTRTPIRGLITRTVNEVEAELENENRDILTLKTKYERLNELQIRIQELDQLIFNEMLDNDLLTDDDRLNESVATEEILTLMVKTKLKIDKVIYEIQNIGRGNNEDAISIVRGGIIPKRQFKLPKIELKKFSSKIIDWLSWWSLFEKIHNDENLATVDKFQYLIQSIDEKTRAYEIVKGFPATEQNYPKAIAALKERFGNEKILIQVYIRELFQMGLQNVKEKPDIISLYDKLTGNVRSLESLGVTLEQATLFLYPMIESSLPDEIMIAWQRSCLYEKDGSNEQPPKGKLDYLLEFIKQEVEREEQRSLAKAEFFGTKDSSKQSQKKKEFFTPTASGLHVSTLNIECIFCGRQHLSQECNSAMEMSLDQKWKIIKEKKACGRCLKQGHSFFNCKYKSIKCSGCTKSHYHLICPDSPLNNKNKGSEVKKTATTNSGSNNISNMLVILKTILISVNTKEGPIIARALIDDGSQRSYITTKLARLTKGKFLGKFFERNTLFGGLLTDIEERSIYEVSLGTLNGKQTFKVELPDKEKITGEIQKLPKGPWLDELKSLKIWINDYNSKSEEIDILIGADLIPKLTTDKSVMLKCGLKAVQTVFGWTIMGPIPSEIQLSTSMNLVVSHVNELNLNQLWDLETIGIRDPVEIKLKDEKNRKIKEHFINTVHYTEDGKYKVALPWANGVQSIPNNFKIAEKRLVNATKKLKQDGMYDTYGTLFEQWEKENFIEEIMTEQSNLENCHYIPHHPVYKLESKTTPVRPVFDASCKIGRHPSLNECLEKGPNLIELIPDVMLRFREGKVGVISDIRKAFQMIEVDEKDQNYLRFLWWEDDTNTKIKIFKHKRVVFGLKCSPFILGAVIEHHLNNVSEEYYEIAQKLKKSLYVDNSITSVDSLEEYEAFKEKAIYIFAKANMELRQWEHNILESSGIGLIQDVGLGGSNTNSDEFNFVRFTFGQTIFEQEDDISSVLGMKWNKRNDTLSCTSIPVAPDNLSKRTLLATINKVFDPMGFLSPAMVYPKLMLQSTWENKINWDDELPKETKIQFAKWIKELHYLKEVEIPRNIKNKSFSKGKSTEQLHIFCDASKVAYSAGAFLRVVNEDGISVQLIQAKARIAPINKLTIPRMELMACTIGARLGNSIQNVFEQRLPYFYWSDSTTALAWIKRNDEWGTFVGNRVREIITLSSAENWRHVPGKLNPADFPSRGCSPKELLQSIWWEGPEWLKHSPDKWPNQEFHIDEDTVNVEKKKSVIMNNNLKIISISEDPWYSKKSSHILNLRQLAWVKRFVHNCSAKKRNRTRISGHLTMKEIDDAEVTMVKMVQNQVFPLDSNYIAGLRVLRDNQLNVYYVVTKLLYRQDTGRFKKPLLLPCEHPMVDKLIVEEHLKHGHAGGQFLVNKLREKFWIIHAKKAVKRIKTKCTVCIRFSKSPSTVPVAPLPENRVKNAKVFEVTGIDLAGPLYLRNNDKQWVVIFTCAVIRAVHFELVDKIDTEQFLLALGRFIYRKGRPSIVYTDCGTNFISTANAFGRINWNKVTNETNVQRITWIFNPPAAPWWGGFWERLVRMLKEYLRRILGHNKLTKTELDTTICFVESLMNDRPLTYLSDDPNDLIPLTPAAFLRDIQESSYPEIENVDGKKLREKLRHLNQLKNELRERFRSEYLGQLVEKTKPTDIYKFEEGEVVLIASEDKQRMEWPMARILELIPGKDGEIRVAKLKTSKGELIRPLQKLIPMEIKSGEKELSLNEDIKIRAQSLQYNKIVVVSAVVKNRSRVKKSKQEELVQTVKE